MKNLGVIFAFCGILAVSNLVAQDNDGMFVGFEVGAGSFTRESGYKNTITNAVYGGQIGYKYSFDDWRGLRAYFAINYAEIKSTVSMSGTNIASSLNALIYTANADALFDFYNDVGVNYGAFVGLGLGGVSYEIKTTGSGIASNEAISGFYIDLKLGLRAQTGHSEFNFVVGIPFINNSGAETNIKQDYKITFTYSYTFYTTYTPPKTTRRSTLKYAFQNHK